MTTHYPIVLEHEPNGTISAFVVGMPGVYAAADIGRLLLAVYACTLSPR